MAADPEINIDLSRYILPNYQMNLVICNHLQIGSDLPSGAPGLQISASQKGE